MLLFVTKVLVLDSYLIEKVLDVLDVFQVLWVLELVLVLANMKKYLYLTQVLRKVLDPNPAQLSITEIICKIKYLKFHSNFQGDNELITCHMNPQEMMIQPHNKTKHTQTLCILYVIYPMLSGHYLMWADSATIMMSPLLICRHSASTCKEL